METKNDTARCVRQRCAAALRSMCQCVSRWRPAEVDGLAFGRRRRRSAALGTRSVMESLAAPSVEAMTPSTPLLPPNARRFPFVTPLGVSPAGARYPTTADVTAAPRYHPSDRPLPWPAIALLLNLVVTPAREKEAKRDGKKERDGEPPMLPPAPTPRAAHGCSARHARGMYATIAMYRLCLAIQDQRAYHPS